MEESVRVIYINRSSNDPESFPETPKGKCLLIGG